ncbi:MAG TPA: hypothetical protein DCG75_01890 [Bacteroidales bacterium]|nr:hypothetical protein [Bacteroidales bacterium]
MKIKNIRIILIVTIIIIILSTVACVEDYDLGFNSNDYSVVINGLITNEDGPYYVRLTKSSPNFTFKESDYFFIDGADPIKGALVIISDNTGVIDTLIPTPRIVTNYNYQYDSIGNIIDSTSYEELYPHSSDFGYYQTTKLHGKAGNTYYLYISFENKIFEAGCYMPDLPKIDSMKIEEIIVKESDGTKGWVPIIYFKEPQYEKNYYLFDIGTCHSCWTFSVIDDKLLEEYVNGLNVDDGEHPDWWRVNYPYGPGFGKITVTMSSLTEKGFNYYRGLINQFNNDGGVYSPSPTSPKTNISNGGLGFFRASAVNRITREYGIVP